MLPGQFGKHMFLLFLFPLHCTCMYNHYHSFCFSRPASFLRPLAPFGYTNPESPSMHSSPKDKNKGKGGQPRRWFIIPPGKFRVGPSLIYLANLCKPICVVQFKLKTGLVVCGNNNYLPRSERVKRLSFAVCWYFWRNKKNAGTCVS